MNDPESTAGVAGASRQVRRCPWGIYILPWLLAATTGFGIWVAMRDRKSAIPEVSVAGIHQDITELLQRMRQRVVASPGSADAWGTYGKCLLQHERPREALVCFEEASRLDESSIKWKYFAGVIEEQTDFAKARDWYQQAASIGRGDLSCRLRLASVLVHLARIPEALEQLTGLRTDYPAVPEVYVELLRVRRLAGDIGDVPAVLATAASHGAESKALLVEAAVAEMQRGDSATARKYHVEAGLRSMDVPTVDPWMNELRRLDVSGAVASLHADGLMRQGQINQAAEAMASLARRFPMRSRAALNHAMMLLDQGLPDAAVRELSDLTGRFPDDPLIRFQYAIALARTQNQVAAEAELRECLRLKSDYGIARAALGDILELSGRVEESIECYRTAMADAVDDVRVRLAFAALLIRQKRWTEAETVLADAEHLADGSEAILTDLTSLKQSLANERSD